MHMFDKRAAIKKTSPYNSCTQILEQVDPHVMREHPHGRCWWNTTDGRDHSVMC